MSRVAVLGAGGFIGNRLVELLHMRSGREVAPVARRASALALTARFALPGRVADALDGEAMTVAFAGCDAVVTAVAGPPATITGMCQPLIDAARAARVRRIVHLSSQMVHGQAPPPGTSEGSPFPSRQPLAYNRAKAVAERWLAALANKAGIELVILRPGIVYGPRSRWTGGLADDLLDGRCFLASDAAGICNAVYVDNLAQAIELAIDAPDAAEETFFVNDREELRWSDLIEPVAAALGMAAEDLPRPSLAEALAGPGWKQRHLLPAAKRALGLLPRRAAHTLRAARAAAFEKRETTAPPAWDRELALLQSCAARLPDDKAQRRLGYTSPVPHAEAMRRSIAWLGFAGYPVR